MNLTLPNAEREITGHIEELSREELQKKPPAGGWSREQVLHHLLMAYGATCAEMNKRLAKGTLTKRKTTLKERVAQVAMLRFGYFPPGRNAPEFTNPEQSNIPPMDGSSLAAAFRISVGKLADCIDRTELQWGKSAKVATHPIIGPLTAEQWRRFHALHALHHVKQIDRIQGALEAN